MAYVEDRWVSRRTGRRTSRYGRRLGEGERPE
jgi:hypothetical protein